MIYRRMHRSKSYKPRILEGLVVKVRPVLYSSEKDLNNPKSRIKICADLWITANIMTKANVKYYPTCTINFKDEEIFYKEHKLAITNKKQVFNIISEVLFGYKANG